MNKKQVNDWDEVLSAAARLQGHLTEAVLVGGTASALFAAHRTSYDADHVLPNLREEFDDILASLESVAGWQTARIKKPVLILGKLDGIETGVRQLIRSEPLETTEIFVRGQKITAPTEGEILRIKAALILKRNATRDYLDFAALSDHMGGEATGEALKRLDELYPQPSGESALQQLYMQLANPKPFDLQQVHLAEYKNLAKNWQDWDKVAEQCRLTACTLLDCDSLIQRNEIKEKLAQQKQAPKMDTSMTLQYDAKRSLGFTWKLPENGLHILKAHDCQDALFTFHKYRVEHVNLTLRTLEHIPCTYAQTRSILDGKSTAGLSLRQLRSIENYGKACENLTELLDKDRFFLNKETLCALHRLVGKDEAKNFGQFRGHQVFIEQSHYIPPKSEHLEGLFNEGVTFLNTFEDTQEKALCTFLFLSRSQFFSDCNKRTANLVMNGILMQGGFQPINIEGEQFLEKMAQFYETSNATEVMAEINTIAMRQYRVDEPELEQQAMEIKTSQEHLANSAEAYNAILQNYTEAKIAQCERLEEALTERVTEQQAAVTKCEKQRPGAIRSLWCGAAWQKEQTTKQDRLKNLEQRLSRVQSIKADTQKIARMAEMKLRCNNEELTRQRDALLKSERKKILSAQERTQSQKAQQGHSRGLVQRVTSS